MSSYLTVTSNDSFLLKFFEERVVQKSVFQDYFKTNQIAGSLNYAKMLLEKYWGNLKIMSNEDH